MIFNVIYTWQSWYVVILSSFIITRQSIIHTSTCRNERQLLSIGSSIGLFICSQENDKFIVHVACYIRLRYVPDRLARSRIFNFFTVVVITSMSKELTCHATLRDNTDKLCCMNNKKRKEAKEKNVVTVP